MRQVLIRILKRRGLLLQACAQEPAELRPVQHSADNYRTKLQCESLELSPQGLCGGKPAFELILNGCDGKPMDMKCACRDDWKRCPNGVGPPDPTGVRKRIQVRASMTWNIGPGVSQSISS